MNIASRSLNFTKASFSRQTRSQAMMHSFSNNGFNYTDENVEFIRYISICLFTIMTVSYDSTNYFRELLFVVNM